MMKIPWKKNPQQGATIMELLLATCILSAAIAPLFYILNFTRKTQEQSKTEFVASLLAQHVMEEIVGFTFHNRGLPPMTKEEPVVFSPARPQKVSEYFQEILGCQEGIDEKNFPSLFWALTPFSCKVDTYLIENNLFKVIVYIYYEEGGKKKRVFLERLLSRNGTGEES